jgi:hypothetical protein
MHAQNWKQPFDEDVAKAKDRHQNAIFEAHEEFKKAEAEAWQQRNADYRAAEDAWNALKSLPECTKVAEARDAFQRAKEPALLAPARRALADAIDRADRAFNAEVAAVAGQHNVTIH